MTPPAEPSSTRRWRRAARRGYRRLPLPLRSRVARLVDRYRPAPRARYPVPVGAGLAGSPADQLPVVILVTLGTAGPSLGRVVDEVAAIQVATRAFRPLFVTDADDFAPFRRHGYLFEHVMAADGWSSLHDPSVWSAYVAGRLAQLRRVYGAEAVLTVPADASRDVLRSLLARTLSSPV